jgi:hypothetical protein
MARGVRREDDNASFNRLFARQANDDGDNDGTPSVHELFSRAMRDDISLRAFAEALVSLHGIRLTPSAVRLLTSTDASSGRLSFAQFQRALQEADAPDCGAGLPMVIRDQAAAIISDNSGAPTPPFQSSAAKQATDISADPFIKQQVRIERAAAKGPFGGNPVVQTNHTSAGNPLVAPSSGMQHRQEEVYDSREMANTATRMFVGGDISRADYESFLAKFGVRLTAESELRRLITAHEKVGDGNFMQFTRALSREIEIADASNSVR